MAIVRTEPPGTEYRRRNPEKAVLYQVLQEHLETFLARGESEAGRTDWPGFVKRELRALLDCGILARGFCRLHCPRCGKDELVAFSCKGRGVCPSCGGRRMADTAAYLADQVLPEVPIRQWVLTVPHRIRYLIAFDKKRCAEVKRIFIRAVQSHLRLQARRQGIRKGQFGAVVFMQRFGGALNLNPHFHALVLDGVYSRPAEGTDIARFYRLPAPTDEEVAAITLKIQTRIQARLGLAGAYTDSADQVGDPLPFQSPLLAECYAASIQGRVGLGGKRGAYVHREGRDPKAPFVAFSGRRCAQYQGFTLHADVWIHGRKKERLERLCRYVARNAIATKRLKRLEDGRLYYRLRRPYQDGTKGMVFEPLVFIEKLCALVPPPRQHLVTYHGVLAPNAALRDRVVPRSKTVTGSCCLRKRKTKNPIPLEEATEAERQRRYTFAELMRRVFERGRNYTRHKPCEEYVPHHASIPSAF